MCVRESIAYKYGDKEGKFERRKNEGKGMKEEKEKEKLRNSSSKYAIELISPAWRQILFCSWR
jgi:hypothetical protein